MSGFERASQTDKKRQRRMAFRRVKADPETPSRPPRSSLNTKVVTARTKGQKEGTMQLREEGLTRLERVGSGKKRIREDGKSKQQKVKKESRNELKTQGGKSDRDGSTKGGREVCQSSPKSIGQKPTRHELREQHSHYTRLKEGGWNVRRGVGALERRPCQAPHKHASTVKTSEQPTPPPRKLEEE